MAQKAFAVIAGAGPGTGASIARRFAATYPVALLARNADKYESLVQEITSNGGKAIGIPTDVSSEQSVKDAFKKITDEFQDSTCAAAIFNVSGPVATGPLLDIDPAQFEQGWQITCKGGLLFSQASLPHLLKHAESSLAKHPPTLIFTGASGSVKASAGKSGMAMAKWSLRALSGSIAREFAPKGVHVAHAIIDGIIDTPEVEEMMPDMETEKKMSPDGIADMYWYLHKQDKRSFTYEVDIRSHLENF